jgi:hypothetical protein
MFMLPELALNVPANKGDFGRRRADSAAGDFTASDGHSTASCSKSRSGAQCAHISSRTHDAPLATVSRPIAEATVVELPERDITLET